MKTLPRLTSLVTITLIAFIVGSCSKNQSDTPATRATQTVSLYLTDNPGMLEHVYIDIKSVKVAIDTCAADQGDFSEIDNVNDKCLAWSDLNMQPGVYDILELQNGIETLLASGEVATGTVKLINIKLGNKNSVVADGVTFPLTNANDKPMTIALKLKGNEWDQVENSHIRLWLDFDVFHSILNTNGQFSLKPFIHFFNDNTTAKVKGNVQPMEAIPVVTIFNNKDTAIAMPGMTGDFKMRGLKPGRYTVMIGSLNNYKPVVVPNITVDATKQTDLGTIRLKKQ